jgi:ribosome maturation factor RimP
MGKKKPVAKSPPREAPAGPAGTDNERDLVSRVWELAEPLCAAEGVELIHIEYQRESGGRILRLYIEKPGGVSLDDCSAVSQQLSDILDIKLETEAAYTLEVSSPGPERPLSRASDFDRFRGYTAKIRVSRPIHGQKNFTGVLAGYSDDTVWLSIGTETVGIARSQITKARLVNYI